MPLRRLFLALGLAMVLSLVAAALVGPRRPVPPPATETAGDTETARETAPRSDAEEIAMKVRHERARAGRADPGASEERVELGTHVILTVRSSVPGQVELRDLGQVRPVEARTPAIFDLLADRPGRYGVEFTPTGAEEARIVGVIAVHR